MGMRPRSQPPNFPIKLPCLNAGVFFVRPLENHTLLYDNVRMSLSPLTAEQRAEIFAEGKRAAIAKAGPFACPYIRDADDVRFMEWTDGYRSISAPIFRISSEL